MVKKKFLIVNILDIQPPLFTRYCPGLEIKHGPSMKQFNISSGRTTLQYLNYENQKQEVNYYYFLLHILNLLDKANPDFTSYL